MTTILTQRHQHLLTLLPLHPSPRAVVAALLAINDLAVTVDYLSATLPPTPSSSSSSPSPYPFPPPPPPPIRPPRC